jgi:hypothetical protein
VTRPSPEHCDDGQDFVDERQDGRYGIKAHLDTGLSIIWCPVRCPCSGFSTSFFITARLSERLARLKISKAQEHTRYNLNEAWSMLQPLQPPVDGSKSLQAEEDEELARLMRQLHSAREKCHPSFAAVPKFYSSNGATPIDSSPSAVADAWRSRVLQQRLGLEALHRWGQQCLY